MSKAISTVVINKLNIGAYLLEKPNVRITGEYKSALTFSNPHRGHLVKIAFGHETNEPIEEMVGCSFSELELRLLIAEFELIADYLKEKNASN